MLRMSSQEIGPDHEETLYLQKYLEKVVRDSGRSDEATEIYNKIKHYGTLILFYQVCNISDHDFSRVFG